MAILGYQPPSTETRPMIVYFSILENSELHDLDVATRFSMLLVSSMKSFYKDSALIYILALMRDIFLLRGVLTGWSISDA